MSELLTQNNINFNLVNSKLHIDEMFDLLIKLDEKDIKILKITKNLSYLKKMTNPNNTIYEDNSPISESELYQYLSKIDDADYTENSIKYIEILHGYDVMSISHIQVNDDDYLEYWVDCDNDAHYYLIIKSNIEDIKILKKEIDALRTDNNQKFSLKEFIQKSENIMLMILNNNGEKSKLYQCKGPIPEQYLPE